MIYIRPAIIGVLALVALLALFGSSTPPSASATDCGPHSHWIDDCSAGTDSLSNTSAVVGLDTDADCVEDTTVTLSGPTDIVRQAPSDVSANFGGVGSIDAHLDVIDIEIISMDLSGVSLIGPLRVGVGGTPALSASQGATEEQSGDAFAADSFFDVFIEIEIDADLYYNQSALRIKAVIPQYPPNPIYPPDPIICIDLFSAPSGGVDTGVNLVDFQFDPDPPAVGGIAEVLVDGSDSPASAAGGSGSSAGLYAAIAGGIAAVAVAVAGGGWYARRRWLR